MARAGARVTLTRSPEEAVRGAHLVVTDVWASMGQEDESQERMKCFDGFQVNAALLDKAAADVLFMHCLPAHRGEEISDNLLMTPELSCGTKPKIVLHAQKALLEFLLCREE